MKKLMKYQELILERLSPDIKWNELIHILHKKLGFNISDLIYDISTELEDEEMKCGFFISANKGNNFTGIITYDTKRDLDSPNSWVKHDKHIHFLDIYKSKWRDDIRNIVFEPKIDVTIYSKNGLNKDFLFEVIDKYCAIYKLKILNDPRIKNVLFSENFITLCLSK